MTAGSRMKKAIPPPIGGLELRDDEVRDVVERGKEYSE